MNFVPKMNRDSLINGYKNVLNTIYAPKQYYARIKTLLNEYKPKAKVGLSQIKWQQIIGLVNCIWFLGIGKREEDITGDYLLRPWLPGLAFSSVCNSRRLWLSFPQGDQ